LRPVEQQRGEYTGIFGKEAADASSDIAPVTLTGSSLTSP
jgi:hypothetical protein